MDLPTEEVLPEELRRIVQESGAILGAVIEREAGAKKFSLVEELRASMAKVRGERPDPVVGRLRAELEVLRNCTAEERHTVGKSFTLFLELMNSCENAYRSFRLREKSAPPGFTRGNFSLIYVLTAHPTEARGPENIALFQGVQEILFRGLQGSKRWRENLRHQLELAWRAYPTRQRVPRVKDEAVHIYRTSLRPEILRALLSAGDEFAPLYLRTWVGGDKDGHPGVDERAMLESLSLSRRPLVEFAQGRLAAVRKSLELLPASKLERTLVQLQKVLPPFLKLKAGDGGRMAKSRKKILDYCVAYEKEMGAQHPALVDLVRLFHVFPALVVSLELRESSDVLMAGGEKSAAIRRMLKLLAGLSKGGNPRWYVRGFIVSMTESVEHLAKADALVRAALGKPSLPVIPLFETVDSLNKGPEVIAALLKHKKLRESLKLAADRLEIMVGYSDSSKQGGVFPSRLAIAGAMHELEAVALKANVTPIFFQGSGGSVDRGGGSVQDQVAWWPRSALKNYKVTIQGEMVERSFSSPEITRGQILRISQSVTQSLEKEPKAPSSAILFCFAEKIRLAYEGIIHEPEFLELVGKATPYAHLSELKIGSRPARRTTEISVEGLRAIPWVLCWTQTRMLFQTWWGVGTAWEDLGKLERQELKTAFAEEPVFRSYVKALGFTLAKIELPIWRIYLENSGLSLEVQAKFLARFEKELSLTTEMLRYCSESENPLWFRPWLGASIRLRSPMIHPLNLLQVLAMQEGDSSLFRTTATGISAGMMTTG